MLAGRDGAVAGNAAVSDADARLARGREAMIATSSVHSRLKELDVRLTSSREHDMMTQLSTGAVRSHARIVSESFPLSRDAMEPATSAGPSPKPRRRIILVPATRIPTPRTDVLQDEVHRRLLPTLECGARQTARASVACRLEALKAARGARTTVRNRHPHKTHSVYVRESLCVCVRMRAFVGASVSS